MQTLLITNPARTLISGLITETAHRGGASRRLSPKPGRRYVVSFGRYGLRLSRAQFFNGNGADRIAAVLDGTANAERLAPWRNWAEGFGAWVDGPTVYVDPHSTHDDLRDALTIARTRGELAIYDTLTNETIRTDA